METMWAPWRIEYIKSEKESGCVFCHALTIHDELTLYKGDTTLVVMNKYPYINGHLLVAPIRHLSRLDELSRNEMRDINRGNQSILNNYESRIAHLEYSNNS